VYFDPTLCDKVFQWLATGQWFSQSPPVSSTNKTDSHDIVEIFLKAALSTIKQTNKTEKLRKKNLLPRPDRVSNSHLHQW
jgi:hypothetical protein